MSTTIKCNKSGNKIEISQAEIEDLVRVYEIVKSCSDDYASKGIVSWKGYTQEKVNEKFKTGKILLLIENDIVIGVASLSSNAPAYFYENKCGENNTSIDFLKYFTFCKNPVYLSMFGIYPSKQKFGYGSSFLKNIEIWCKTNLYDSIRIDVNEKIPGLIGFYEKRGFVKLPYFIDSWGIRSWIMEKVLL